MEAGSMDETDRPIGERIAIYRRRRGISQAVLAGLVGRSESWLSQVERGARSVDRLSVLIDMAKVLKVDVATLTGQPFKLGPNGSPEVDKSDAIRKAILEYHGPMDEPSPSANCDRSSGPSTRPRRSISRRITRRWRALHRC
jgi:transcriptional regulator with XRE-family HTH domain